MTEDYGCKATDPQELRRQIMSANVPKNEREWWASREIERLSQRSDSCAVAHTTLVKELAAERAEKERLRVALTKLSNEVLGSLPLMEPLARKQFGNTNYNILIQRAEEARAARAAPAPAEAHACSKDDLIAAALELSCDDQLAIAAAVAENVGHLVIFDAFRALRTAGAAKP